jgi:hypothetical protein
MVYKFYLKSSFKNDAKDFKHAKAVQNEIIKGLDLIRKNPAIGVGLSGAWLGFYKYKFRVAGTQYRLIFAHYPCCNTDENATKDENTVLECAYNDATVFDCSGFIDFCFVRTRGEMVKLYAQNKKYIDGFRRTV